MTSQDANQEALTPRLGDADKAKLLRIGPRNADRLYHRRRHPGIRRRRAGVDAGGGGLRHPAAAGWGIARLHRAGGGFRALYLTVQECAVSAAVNDYRFSPVTAPELDDLLIEISALSPFRLINSPEEIVVGQHGLLIRKGFHVGLLLAPGAGDRAWSRGQFLDAICAKAGLPQRLARRRPVRLQRRGV